MMEIIFFMFLAACGVSLFIEQGLDSQSAIIFVVGGLGAVMALAKVMP